MRRRPICIAASLVIAAAAHAEPVTPTGHAKSQFTFERHFTTNALDSETARDDWYSLLRGSVSEETAGPNGSAKTAAEFQTTGYDAYAIEDDHAFAIAAEATRKIGAKFEIRGALTYRVVSKGDDLEIGTAILGTRTVQHIAGAETQLGVDLGKGASLVVTLAATVEDAGLTAFQSQILPPIKLQPDRNRLAVSVLLSRTLGPLTLGIVAAADWVMVEAIAFPPSQLSYLGTTLKGEASYKSAAGTAVALAAGIQTIRSAGNIFVGARPTFLAAFAHPFANGFEFRGKASAAFESAGSDDPLSSWLRRAELELAYRPKPNLEIGAGLFGEIKENLLFENEERTRGLYVETAYKASERIVIAARIDYRRTFATVVETTKRTLDSFISVTARM